MVARVAAALVVAAVLAGGALAVLGHDSRDSDRSPAVSSPAVSFTVPREGSRVASVRAQPLRRGPIAARLLRRVQLRDRPGGHVVRALGPLTGFGSPRVLAVVARRPGWLGVLSQHMPNSRAGWIPAGGAQLLLAPYALHVDLSARELVVRHEGRVLRRLAVAVGRAGSATPTGRFAVTDALRTARGGGPYGCCALALSGRQPNLPQGWTGGDRIAIHGTTNEATLGTPASSGCLRASDRDMRWLLSRIPLGTIVRIRA